MKIVCYLSPGCLAESVLRKNITEALVQESVDAEVHFFRISEDEAKELGLIGSPSVLIDGRDIQPADVQGFS